MPSFGEKLKLEREKRKISLEQISSTTKIGTRMLQALEDEKFNQLPGGIFNKGFVRAYARAVGLDEDQTVADYLQASGDAPRPELLMRDGAVRDAARDAVVEETASRHSAARNLAARHEENRIRLLEATSDEPSRSLPWGIFAIALLLIALALSLWSHRRREQERLEGHPAAKTPTPLTHAAPVNVTPSPALANADRQTSPISTSVDSSPPQASRSAAQISQPGNFPTTGELQVLVHAREESWISVSIDGKFTGSETLAAGNDRLYKAQSRIYLKAGNSGALDFQLDGKKLDIGGAYGEVKAVTIGHSGVIHTPASLPTNP